MLYEVITVAVGQHDPLEEAVDEGRPVEPAVLETVITSYSIHYTKL